VVVKIALEEGLTPIAIATFRFLIAGALFLVAFLIEKKRRNYKLLVKKRELPTLLLLALTGVTFFFTAQYTGIQMAGPPIAAILVCLLSPILITIFSTIIFKEHLTKKQASGIGIAALGTFIVIVSGTTSFSGDQKQFLLGSLILLSTPILWATYSLLGKKMTDRYSPFLVAVYVNVLGGLCLIPFSLAEHSFYQISTISLNGWLAILFLAITCSLLGYFIWLYVMKQVGASITSSFLFAEPVVTVLFSIIFLGERLSVFIFTGAFLIFIGVYLVTRK
jgi:drug/metabolite transporter (DMT)-like permease